MFMKKNFKKLISTVLVICLSLTCLAGCTGGKKTSSNGETRLKFIIGGVGQMADCQKVWDEFNVKLQDFMPGTYVDFEVISYTDYAEKWQLMASTREKVDVMWFGWMLSLKEEVSKGALYPMTDLLKNVPDLTNELPSWVIDIGKVGKEVYAIPCYQMMTNLPYGVKTQAALAEKYNFDGKTMTETFANKRSYLKREDFKPVEDYLEKLKAGGDLQKGVSPSFLMILSGIGTLGGEYEQIVANAVIDASKPDVQVLDQINDFPGERKYYETVRDWFNKGYIRKDILS